MTRTAGRLDSPAVRLVILIGVLVTIVLSLAVPLRSYVRQTDANEALAASIAQREASVAALEGRLDEWQDQNFVVEQARTRLHYVYPGETGYIVIDAANGSAPVLPAPAAGTPKANEGWYTRMWDSIDEARG